MRSRKRHSCRGPEDSVFLGLTGGRHECRVLSSELADAPLMKARLRLVEAAKTVLARTLGLMGMSAPETM
ncbi:MAG: hypothetical protein IIC73_05550 [Armatimonadetes bacterium]|nr:hypothetical protein [Armatimonadota bacterium]